MNDEAPVKKKWQKEISALWPAAKGSLAKVYKPCIRKNCPACARGDKHLAWLLSFTSRGRRKTMYVPLALVPTIKKALQSGRKIEQLLYQTGPNLLKHYRLAVKRNVKPPIKS
jgi:hypothetical protein